MRLHDDLSLNACYDDVMKTKLTQPSEAKAQGYEGEA
jgi:hypothetical protein